MAVVGNYEHLEAQTSEQDAEDSNKTTALGRTGLLKILQSDIRLPGRVGLSVAALCAVLILLNIVLLICLSQSNKERDPLVTEFPGWQKFGSGCYYISTGETSWESSRQWCRDRQSDLIVINSKEKQDFVAHLYQTVWLGLTDKVKEDIFEWVDGTTLTTPTFWSPGQPDNRRAETNATQECVVFDTKTRGWTDVFCFRSFRWICEKAC